MHDPFFRSQIEKHGAVPTRLSLDQRANKKLPTLSEAPADKAVWFETPNHGWIYSAKDANGVRHFILKY